MDAGMAPVSWFDQSQMREMVLDGVCMTLAGRAAEEVVCGTISGGASSDVSARSLAESRETPDLPDWAGRTSQFMEHEVFHRHHSETEMLRYLHKLESRDLSLNTSMIPLGSCTMKLNATTQMAGVTWPEFGKLHPSAPSDQAAGYQQIFSDLEEWLAEITGFAAVSLRYSLGSAWMLKRERFSPACCVTS